MFCCSGKLENCCVGLSTAQGKTSVWLNVKSISGGPNLEFVNPIDLRELHVVVKQGLSNDVQDTEPLSRREKETNWVRSKLDMVKINHHLTERG